jgi:hypothetical protein
VVSPLIFGGHLRIYVVAYLLPHLLNYNADLGGIFFSIPLRLLQDKGIFCLDSGSGCFSYEYFYATFHYNEVLLWKKVIQ